MARHLLLANLVLALAAGSAMAQDVRQYRAGDSVDPRDVAQILGAPKMKMRSLRLLDDSPSAQQAQPAATVTETPDRPVARARVSSLSLPVQFAFDSADILPGAKSQLDSLAEGIRLLPAIQAVVIEGHTDAVGSDFYNEQLSQRRAYAVKRYLVTMHAIDPGRLRAIGMGKFVPLPGREPQAAENRRVQFRGE
ncbi:MAG TPA: OmpA family protein [Albitalea sp.]|uniref:OmpA family protein n=1 Tax=Piscinibacter sp. TaxID=1903157 RepID=UPI002ED38734